MIPKKIWRTCPSVSALPEIITSSINKLSADNPEWTQRVLDDEEMLEYIRARLGPRVIDTLNPRYMVCMADLWRYLVMYEEGGLYLDIKSTASRVLDEVIRPSDTCLMSMWHERVRPRGGEWQQWFLCAAPGSRLMRRAVERAVENLENYTPEVQGVGMLGVFRTTGPTAFSDVVTDVSEYREVFSGKDLGLVYTVMGGPMEHYALFHPHYSMLTEGIKKA